MAEKIVLTDAAYEYVKSVLAKHPKIKTAIKKGEYPSADDAVMLELKKSEVIIMMVNHRYDIPRTATSQ